MSGNPIQSWILDSTLSIPNSGYWIPDSLSAELVFWIPVVSGILDFLSWITDFKARDSRLRIPVANISCDFGFCKQRSPGLRNQLAKISRIVESRLPYMGRYNDMAGIFVCLFVFVQERYTTHLIRQHTWSRIPGSHQSQSGPTTRTVKDPPVSGSETGTHEPMDLKH